jgi:hypothetical protein
VILCSLVDDYQRFGGTRCFIIHSYSETPRQQANPKLWHPSTKQHDVHAKRPLSELSLPQEPYISQELLNVPSFLAHRARKKVKKKKSMWTRSRLLSLLSLLHEENAIPEMLFPLAFCRGCSWLHDLNNGIAGTLGAWYLVAVVWTASRNVAERY